MRKNHNNSLDNEMAQKKKRLNRSKLYLDPAGALERFVEWTNATQTIYIPMIMAKPFVESCKRGNPWQCLLAEAIKELYDQSPDKFPHPVIEAYVKLDVLYITTHGQRRHRSGLLHPYQAIRYGHNFRRTLCKFDSYTKKQFLDQFGDASSVAPIGPPRIHGSPGVRGIITSHKREETPPTSVPERISDGALRRAFNAHLITAEEAKRGGLKI